MLNEIWQVFLIFTVRKEMWMRNKFKIHHVEMECKAFGQPQTCPFNFKSTYQQMIILNLSWF